MANAVFDESRRRGGGRRTAIFLALFVVCLGPGIVRRIVAL